MKRLREFFVSSTGAAGLSLAVAATPSGSCNAPNAGADSGGPPGAGGVVERDAGDATAPDGATAPLDGSDVDASFADASPPGANNDAAPPTSGGATLCLSQWPQPDGLRVTWTGVATDATASAYMVVDFDHGGDSDAADASPPPALDLGAPPSRVPNGFAVARFDSECQLVWVREFGPQTGGTYGAVANAIATDAKGNLTILGYFEGSVDFGAGVVNLGSAPGAGVLLRLDPSGATVFAKSFLQAGGSGLAVTPAGVSTIAVQASTDTDVGSGTELGLFGPQTEQELVQFDGTGKVLFRKPDSSVNGSIATITQIATNASGFLWAFGTETSIFNTSSVPADHLLFGLTASGSYGWQQAATMYTRVGAGPAGGVAATYTGSQQGTETLQGLPADGSSSWTTSRPYANGGIAGFIVDSQGEPVVLSSFEGSTTAGAAPSLTSVGNEDLSYQLFDSTGHLVSVGSWGTPDDDRNGGIGVDSAGNVVLSSASTPPMADGPTRVSFVKLAR